MKIELILKNSQYKDENINCGNDCAKIEQDEFFISPQSLEKLTMNENERNHAKILEEMANPHSRNLIMMKQLIVEFQDKLTFLTTRSRGEHITKCEMKLTSFENRKCNGHLCFILKGFH
jgi:hypothetical protein